MNEYSGYSVTDILALALFGICTAYFANQLGKKAKFLYSFFLVVSLVHFLSLIYGLKVTGGADAKGYYRLSLYMTESTWVQLFSQGTNFIYFVTFPLVHYLKFSYSGCYVFFSCFGLAGYYYLTRTIVYYIEKYSLKYKKEYFYILLMPGLHIWNIAIGKDSLMFFAIALFFAGISRVKYLEIGIGAFFIGIIRSPVLFLFVVGLTIGNIILNKRAKIGQKVLVTVVFAVLTIVLLPLVQERLKLDDVDYQAIAERTDQRLAANQEGGSSIDMSNASLPAKMFGFMFRPLFYDARSGMMLYASIENAIWLFMVVNIIINLRSKLVKSRYSGVFAMLLFSAMLPILAQSSTLSNLGIAVRMKTMYLAPILLLYFFSYDYAARKKMARKKVKPLAITPK